MMHERWSEKEKEKEKKKEKDNYSWWLKFLTPSLSFSPRLTRGNLCRTLWCTCHVRCHCSCWRETGPLSLEVSSLSPGYAGTSSSSSTDHLSCCCCCRWLHPRWLLWQSSSEVKKERMPQAPSTAAVAAVKPIDVMIESAAAVVTSPSPSFPSFLHHNFLTYQFRFSSNCVWSHRNPVGRSYRWWCCWWWGW